MKPHRQSLCRLLPTLLILAFLLAACQQRGRYHAQLAYIDSLADVRPAEADSLLRALAPAMPSASKADSMHYALMRLKTDDKLYRPITDRQPLALRLVDYYEHHPKGALLPTALFYAGRVSADLGDAPQALEYYQKTLQVYPNGGEESAKSMLHTQMGYIFYYQDLFDDAFQHFSISYNIRKEIKDTVGMCYNLRDVARIYEFKHQEDSALSCYQQALAMAEGARNKELIKMMLTQMAYLHEKKDMPILAKSEIQPALMDIDTPSISAVYAIATKIYRKSGDRDSTKYYLDLLLEHGNVYGKHYAYQLLTEMSAEEKSSQKVLDYLRLYQTYDDSIHSMDNAAVVKRMDAMYNYQLHKREAELLKSDNEKKQWQQMLTLLVLTIVVLFFVIMWRNHRHRRYVLDLKIDELSKYNKQNEETIKRNKEDLIRLHRQLQSKEEAIIGLKRQIIQLSQQNNSNREIIQNGQKRLGVLKEKLQEMENEKASLEKKMEHIKKMSTYMETIVDAEKEQETHARMIVQESDVYAIIKQRCQNGSHMNNQEWEAIEKLINNAYPDFTKKLNSLCHMSEIQLHITLLLKLDLKIKEIATLTNRADNSVSTILQRLTKNVLGSQSRYKKWKDFVKSL